MWLWRELRWSCGVLWVVLVLFLNTTSLSTFAKTLDPLATWGTGSLFLLFRERSVPAISPLLVTTERLGLSGSLPLDSRRV